MKICPVCKETRELEDFPVAKSRKDGRASTCKFCKRKIDQKYHANNYEIKIKPRRQSEQYRIKSLSWRYGISPEVVKNLIDKNNGRCEICNNINASCVDHDHSCCKGSKSCGKCVRGLLCKSCNWTIGHAKDDPQVLRLAAEYLERAAAN